MNPTSRLETAAGFSLLEALAAASVLAMLGITLTSLLSNTALVARNTRKQIEADQQAAAIFARMEEDFGRMIKRRDMDCLFANITGDSGGANDKMFFYSEAPAYFNGSDEAYARSTVALVGYRCNGKGQLERLGKSLAWDGGSSLGVRGSAVFLNYPAKKAVPLVQTTLEGRWPSTVGQFPAYLGEDSDFDVLGDQVFRMEFCFVLKNGTYSQVPVVPAPSPARNQLQAGTAPTLSDDLAQGFGPGSRWYDRSTKKAYLCVGADSGAARWERAGLVDVAAISVSLALLEPEARIRIKSMATLVEVLEDPRPADLEQRPPILVQSHWRRALADAGGESIAGAGVRIYERTFTLSGW